MSCDRTINGTEVSPLTLQDLKDPLSVSKYQVPDDTLRGPPSMSWQASAVFVA